ncbi:GNAT family N-acetyltransferase [Micrococcales bacterium 31B]|nr:GNAT family N-acetyltransferase [Micrococcales bacterium 31B]
MRTATTWAGIFDARVRGHGVATVCHRARTWYLFAVLGLDALRSGHHHLNVASGRALARVGYVATGLQRNDNLVHGRFAHEMLVECVNPADAPWARWWGSDPVPAEFVAARERTRAALDWAAAHVSCRDDLATGASAIKGRPQ